ncbi:MAG: endopeptidase, partial [Mycobacterium sp.]|nr:endopeptidase [Mycobacterium sp.]
MGLGIADGWTRINRQYAIGAIAGILALSGASAGNVLADPANDGVAKLNELSRQAEQTTEAMHSAQLDLNKKVAAQRVADKKHSDDQATLDAAKSRLATFRSAVDKFAASMYMGGRTDGMEAILTAESPQQLIGKLAVQRVISTEMATQMASYRAAGQQAAKAERESAKSAADAKTAAEQAAAVRASLQSKQSQLQVQIAVVKSQYQSLTPGQRTALADPPPSATPVAAARAPE